MTRRVLFVAVALVLSGTVPACAAELLKASVAQRGLWDTGVTELGLRSGAFKMRGLDVDILYTQGGPESHQALISGSIDVACGGGIESAIGAFARGAPLRIIGSEMIGSPDTYWYVPAQSPIRSLKDAAGKTISYSQNGSSSHTALLSLLEQYKVDAKPVATGGHPATLTMTMTGQIDIGRGAAPFGLELVKEGKIRVIARGSEIKARANQTVRVCVANQQTLAARTDAVTRFVQGYRDAVDWMYSNPDALQIYESFAGVPQTLMAEVRDDYFPKAALWPDEIKGLDIILADALKNKFIPRPLAPTEIAEMIQIPPRLK